MITIRIFPLLAELEIKLSSRFMLRENRDNRFSAPFCHSGSARFPSSRAAFLQGYPAC
jgi:hypothetical protein